MSSDQVAQSNTILLVEDVDLTRRLLVAVLSGQGFSLHEAENGQEALDALNNITPDVIVCDMFMPIMNGDEFLQKVHDSEQFKKIPVIMLSADSDRENEKRFLSLGAKAVFQKDCKHQELVDRIKELCSE